MADIEVDYKGATIKQFDANTTETLHTKGTWLEDDLTINSLWKYLGAGAEKVSNFADFSVALKDTGFNTWTPSTTAELILDTATFGTIAADVKNYDYIVRWTFWTDLAYNAGATMKVMPWKQRSIAMHQTYRNPRYYSDFTQKKNTYNRIAGIDLSTAVILYYASNGTLSVQVTGGYGFYATTQTPTLSSTTADNITITLPRPKLYARCSTTYFATARAAEIDKTNSKLYLRCEVFRANKDYARQAIMDEIVAELNQ